MRRFSAVEAEEESSIDITPMLDVVFIMLIFFIVTATFVKESGVEVTRPEASTAQVKSNAGVLIAVKDDGQIWLNRRRVDISSVRPNVERLRAENPQGSVVIQADEAASVKAAVEVLDQVRAAGVTDVSLATKTP